MTSPIAQLDFDQIKQSIVEYYTRPGSAFADYNFEGSALNTIVDILAYNTHTNAYYANMLHSEGFIDTAQKRSSVVSRAKELGYIPRSVTGSRAVIDITLDSVPQNSVFYTLPRGSIFTSTNSNGTYTFLSNTENYSVLSGGTHKFLGVQVIAGGQVSNRFTVNTATNVRSMFSIPNKTIDTSTLRVYVRESALSLSRTEFTQSTNIFDLTRTSKVFFLQESYDGFFQIYFGQDLLGIQPINGNVIEVDYFSCADLALPNDCTNFYFSGSIESASVTNINTTQRSFAGSDKEDILSIKYNAVQTNATKNRSVTASDYEGTLKSKFNFIKSVSVWGGEDNIPPVYGKVFISVQPVSGYVLSESIKTSVILPELKKTSVVSITPVFVDPDYIIAEFNSVIKFNENKTVSNKVDVAALARIAVSDYVTSISQFGYDYLETELVTGVAAIDPGVSSVSISKRIGLKLTPFINVGTRFQRSVNNPLKEGTVYSSKFNVTTVLGLKTVMIRDIPDTAVVVSNSTGSSDLVSSLGLYDSSGVLLSTVGTVNLSSGAFDFTITLTSYQSSSRFINITGVPENIDIITKNNQIIILDNISEDVTVGIPANNTVSIVNYGK